MKGALLSTEEAASGKAVAASGCLNTVVVFLAGGQSCVETAVHVARELYRGRHIVYICEPLQFSWFAQTYNENVLIIEQPFNPFGQKAGALIKEVGVRPIEVCAIVVADVGLESFRFRVLALRLRPSRYVLVRVARSGLQQPMGRISFSLVTGATLFVRIVLKIPGLDTLQKSVRASSPTGSLKDFNGSGWLTLPRAISRAVLALVAAIHQHVLTLLASVLPPLDQPFAIGLAWLARIRLCLKLSPPLQAHREIVHVIPSIGIGGVQRQLVLLLKNRSPDFNHRVVVLRSQDRFFAPELSDCGVNIYYLDSQEVRSNLVYRTRQQSPSDRHTLFSVLKMALPFCSEILKLSIFLRKLTPCPDIVHCWLLYANLAGSIAARLATASYVITSVRNIQSQVQFNYYDPRWQRSLERVTVPLANLITANAPAVAKDYRAFAGARDQQVITVPNGLDVTAIRHLTPDGRVGKRQVFGLGSQDVVIGTVARLAKEKDFETFLRAVAHAHEKMPTLRCLIVGDGPLRAYLESFAWSLDLKRVVQFTGERKDIGDLIQCFDGFLLTSVIEGMPNAVMESQLLGVPVVATRAGGTVDLIKEGETGLLAEIGDHKALASCIERLFTENGLWNRISLAASQQIREGYTIEQLVARTEAVYRTLLDDSTTSAGVLACAE